MGERATPPPGLSRDRLAAAAIGQLETAGVDGLTMRALADRLGVRAASLYWHVRDRRELLELSADALLAGVGLPDSEAAWRRQVLEIATSLGSTLEAHRDAARILLEVPVALDRSEAAARLRAVLSSAGLSAEEASAVSSLIFAAVVVDRLTPVSSAAPEVLTGQSATVSIDNPTRGVTVRAGKAMDTVARTASGRGAGATVSNDGTDVVVRRLGGTRAAVVELDPRYPWFVRVKGGTWRTRLELTDLDVREIRIDGAAAQVECLLPPPRGIVPILVSGGAAGVRLHRPAGTAVVARISAGALQIRLDGATTRAALLDSTWRSRAGGPDRYELRISGGALQVDLDDAGPSPAAASAALADQPVPAEPAVAVDFLLDGIEARLARARG